MQIVINCQFIAHNHQNKMAVFLDSIQKYFTLPDLNQQQKNIDYLMRRLSYHHVPSQLNFLRYEMPVHVSQEYFKCIWMFIQKQKDFVVHIHLQYANSSQTFLKVQNQREVVDLFRVMNSFNKSKNNHFRLSCDQNNTIFLCFSIALIDVLKSLDRLYMHLRILMNQFNKVLPKIITIVLPYLQNNFPRTQKDNSTQDSLDRGYSLLMLIEFMQQRRNYLSQAEHIYSNGSSQTVMQKMDAIRVEAVERVDSSLKILGVSQSFLSIKTQDWLKTIRYEYDQWLRVNRQPKKKRKGDSKNVYGIKILKEQCDADIYRNGSHCQIFFSKFKLILMASMNNEVNKSFDQLSNVITKVQKQLQLVKKICKDPKKQVSKHSFQNQLSFIIYIKDRSCQYVTTYYWQFQKKKQDMQAIIMDYYPQNLQEWMVSQSHLMSILQKIKIMHGLTTAVSWLIDNYVCHRDIKPLNVMLDTQHIPKILDFGSCCSVYNRKHFQARDSRLLGTAGYYFPYCDVPASLSSRMTKAQYQQHSNFDAFSLGKLMQNILMDNHSNVIANLSGLLNYMSNKCMQIDPDNRLTYQQMMFLQQKFIESLQKYYNQE